MTMGTALEEALLDRVRADMDLPGDPQQHRVVVAMSGGVDSSVAAALLVRAGYQVVGITLQLYDHGAAVGKKGACCAGQDIHDARRCADALSIPHYVLDFESRFREQVVEAFADQYLAGQTPIPCVTCNRTVKFQDLLDRARALKASALATGHYVANRLDGGPHRALFTPEDMARDQSYFLFATQQDQVDFLRFPLQSLTKPEIRTIAQGIGLAVAEKPDSQDICFVPEGRYQDVVLKLRPDALTPGEIVDREGKVLGQHTGILNFTVGQRKGLGLGGGDPLYVLALDPDTHRVIVGPRAALAKTRIALRDVNWLGSPMTRDGQDLFVKVRSASALHPGRVLCEEGRWSVVLEAPIEGIAPGQACVFYARPGPGAQVFGGGTIVSAS